VYVSVFSFPLLASNIDTEQDLWDFGAHREFGIYCNSDTFGPILIMFPLSGSLV